MPCAHVLLAGGGHRAHAHAFLRRIADHDRAQPLDEVIAHRATTDGGARMRRMAVHFCPAFCVMSRSTSFRKKS